MSSFEMSNPIPCGGSSSIFSGKSGALKFDELVEAADDNLNPYYNMRIPPYPQRKVRRIVDREPRTELLNQLKELILEGRKQEEIAEIVGHTSVTIRNILRKEYDCSWTDLVEVVKAGKDPNQVLEFQQLIYNPNLDYIPPNNNYVQLGFMQFCKKCLTLQKS